MAAEETEPLRWGARLGAICACAADVSAGDWVFLEAMLELTGARAGFLGLSSADEEPRVVDRGLDSARLAAACDGAHEPAALADAAGSAPVRVLSPTLAAIALGAASHNGPLLRVAVEHQGDQGTLALWFGGEDGALARSTAERFIALRRPLQDALRALAGNWAEVVDAPLEVAALGAWSRCNVPLIFLNAAGGVVAANPAAWRKLELSGLQPELPTWLAEQLESRLEGLRRGGGLPDGVSGDYAWVSAQEGDPPLRVGLAPVSGAEANGDAAWLLSVESGGPSTVERVGSAVEAFGLTPREGEVLAALSDGLSNKLIAEAIGIAEATVKFHLVSVMRKAGTSNRTELISALYSLPV